MKTPSSAAYACIRTRSPSNAPPVIGDDGSTAMTATDRPAPRSSAIRAATSVDLPAPGGPVMPTRWADPASGYSRRRAASATAVRFSTAVSSLASARRSPCLAASLRVAACWSAGCGFSPTLVARPSVRPKVVRHLRDRGPRAEHLGDAGLARRLDIVVRDDPAGRHEDIVEAPLVHERGDPRQ